MKGISIMFLLILGLVAVSEAWKDYSPQDSEDYSSEKTDEHLEDDEIDYELQDLRGFIDNSMEYPENAELDDELQDRHSFSDDSVEYLEDARFDDGLQDLQGFRDDSIEYLEDAQLDEVQELGGINDDFNEYPEDISSYVRNRRGQGEKFRSSIRKAGKSMRGKTTKTQQGADNQDENSMVKSVTDDNLTYVTLRPFPAQDRNETIPSSLAEQVLQIMRNINGGKSGLEIPMSGIKCSSSYPALGRHMPYSASQLTIKMSTIVNTECSYYKSSSINKAVTTASVTFSMSPEPHFLITKIEVEPETEDDFRGSIGSQNNPLDSILAKSDQLIKLYLKKSVVAVFDNFKRSD